MFGSIVAAALAAAGPASIAEHQAACAGKDGWSDPAPPVKIYGNVYNVGTCGIVSLLITSKRGHILLDAATAEAAPSIAANIERLGFKLSDVKLIGGSHEHYDHIGGVAELQRRTGATVMAAPAGFVAYETGVVAKEDPQFGLHEPFAGSKVGPHAGRRFRRSSGAAEPDGLGNAGTCAGQHDLVVALVRRQGVPQLRLRRQHFGRVIG